MKLIGRILAILAMATLVVGITYGLTQTGIISSAMPTRDGPPEGFVEGQQATTASDGTTTQTRPQRGGEGGEGRGGSLFGLMELGKSLGEIAIIVGVVCLINWVVKKIRPRRVRGDRAGPATPSSV